MTFTALVQWGQVRLIVTLTDVGLNTVFQSVVVAKLLYACIAWSWFITASDQHCVDAFFCRSCQRCGYCHPDLPTFNELLEECDDRLFHKLCSNTGHSLHYLLPPPTTASQHYNLQFSTVLQHIMDSYQIAQATSPTATYHTFIVFIKIFTELLSLCDFLVCILLGVSTL